jgi:hypothetical protein
MRTGHLLLAVSIFTGASASLFACGSADGGGGDGLGDEVDSGGTPTIDTGGGISLDAVSSSLASIEINPATAAIESANGLPAKQKFELVAKRGDGTRVPLEGAVVWTADSPQVGSIASLPGGVGDYSASTTQGGVVTVKAAYKGKTATAKLTVRLRIETNDAVVDATSKDLLRKATKADASVKWAYPYDDTVFPRGLSGPTLMWMGGDPTDEYRVEIESPTFSYEAFVKATPPARFEIPQATWTKFVESTTGATTLRVTRNTKAGAATQIAKLGWTIAPGSMRGTIYYWSNREGRIMRIKPGAATPDDFSATSLPAAACTMTCHSVSADGSTLISGGDGLGGAYDLLANKPRFALSGDTTAIRSWNMAAITPNGKKLVLNGDGKGGLYDVDGGAAVAASGLEGVPTWMPAFSPDGKVLLYADLAGAGGGSLFARDFDGATNKFGAARMIADAKAVAGRTFIGYPSGAPDGLWAIYARGSNGYDTRGQCVSGEPTCRYDNRSDLYLANTKTPGAELALKKASGVGYPFAAGDRDTSWNFEPTFAPISAGGYYWVVFTSRRTYGNMATSSPDQTKQLWVAAIEQSPKAGTDPSHAAFRLPGQGATSLNMRGFWALDPCKGDGGACGSGSECCGGYCESAVCKSAPPPCSSDDEKCTTDADCCGGAGLTCINHKCALPGPR